MKLKAHLTNNEKKALFKIWQEYAHSARNSAPVDLHETRAQQEARKARLESNPEEWFKYYFPKYATSEPAPFHKKSSKRIIENPEWWEVRMWSRELAKSTRTMMEVLFLTLVGHLMPDGTRRKKKYVLLISNSLSNACRLLLPYRATLEFNQRIIHDYGVQEKAGTWESEEFTTRKNIAFRALGAGMSPRGTRNEETRPDIILFDDLDTDQDCLNPDMIKKKWRWIEEAAIGTRSISNPTTIIFCGNRIAPDCCVERATKYADFHHQVNIRDAAGRSTWPQKNSEAHIDRVLKQKSYAATQKEYFNNPVTEGAVFKQVYYKKVRPLREYSMLVCYTDPSYKDTSDYKATVLVGKWKDEYHIIKAFVEQTTTSTLVTWHYAIMDMVAGCNCYYFMEEVFLQDIIKKEVTDTGKRMGRHIPLSGDTRDKPDKYMRIESLLEPMNRNGELYFNEAEKDNPGMMLLTQQFLSFGPGSRAHDDGPDAVEGAVWIINRKQVAKTSKPIAIPRTHNSKRF